MHMYVLEETSQNVKLITSRSGGETEMKEQNFNFLFIYLYSVLLVLKRIYYFYDFFKNPTIKHCFKIKWVIDYCDELGQIKSQSWPPDSGLAYWLRQRHFHCNKQLFLHINSCSFIQRVNISPQTKVQEILLLSFIRIILTMNSSITWGCWDILSPSWLGPAPIQGPTMPWKMTKLPQPSRSTGEEART